MVAPFVEELGGPRGGLVIPQLPEVFLEQILGQQTTEDGRMVDRPPDQALAPRAMIALVREWLLPRIRTPETTTVR